MAKRNPAQAASSSAQRQPDKHPCAICLSHGEPGEEQLWLPCSRSFHGYWHPYARAAPQRKARRHLRPGVQDPRRQRVAEQEGPVSGVPASCSSADQAMDVIPDPGYGDHPLQQVAMATVGGSDGAAARS